MRRLRSTLATLRRRRSSRRSRCGPRDLHREPPDGPRDPVPTTRRPDIHDERPEPAQVSVADILRYRAKAKNLASRGDPISANDYRERARRADTMLAARRWEAARPVIAIPMPMAERLDLEIADALADGTVPARVPTLRAAVALFRLRWCCGQDLTTGMGDEHECSEDSPRRREGRLQKARAAAELLQASNGIGVCLDCAGVVHDGECPMIDAFEDFSEAFGLPLPDELDPAVVAVSELPP